MFLITISDGVLFLLLSVVGKKMRMWMMRKRVIGQFNLETLLIVDDK